MLLSDREISEFAWLTSEPAQVASGKSERFTSGWPKKMAVATQSQPEQTACFLHHYARVPASPFPILSGDQSAEHEFRGAFRR